jgi:hypothetical protein
MRATKALSSCRPWLMWSQISLSCVSDWRIMVGLRLLSAKLSTCLQTDAESRGSSIIVNQALESLRGVGHCDRIDAQEDAGPSIPRSSCGAIDAGTHLSHVLACSSLAPDAADDVSLLSMHASRRVLQSTMLHRRFVWAYLVWALETIQRMLR